MENLFVQFSTTIFLISLLSMGATKTAANDLVLDVEGNPLEAGSSYYVRTELSKVGIGGGLVAASKPNEPECPQYVAQLSAGWYRESAIMFLPSDPSLKQIHISTDVNIIFSTSSSRVCSQGVWQLTPDANSGDLYLSTGGGVGNPSPQTTANWFKIEKMGDSGFYQLDYCPSSSTIDAFVVKKDIVCGVIDATLGTDDYNMLWLGLVQGRPSFFNGLSFIKA